MKKWFFYIGLPTLLLAACSSSKTVANNDSDVAQAFIRNVLNNDFNGADSLVIPDSVNEVWMSVTKEQYGRMSDTQLNNHKNADIVINQLKKINDSVTVVNYSTTVDTIPERVKVARINGRWKIDLKYTFTDSL